MTAFDITNPDTWPVVMDAAEVAAIFRRSVGGLKKACQQGKFQPVPYQTKPYRWRRVDVWRALEGGRGQLRKVG
jgi:hypothetical protein